MLAPVAAIESPLLFQVGIEHSWQEISLLDERNVAESRNPISKGLIVKLSGWRKAADEVARDRPRFRGMIGK
jgi:hypothetical protein